MTALGVYVDNNRQHVYSFEQWLGREVDFVHGVIGFQSWDDYISSASWSVNSLWKNLGRDVHWSVPLISKDGNLWDAAQGDYKHYYEKVAQTILSGTPGTDKIYVRTGWEANGTWFFWNAIGKEEAFKGAFREFVETFRSVSDRFIFEWNVAQASGGLDPATIYPGDEWVDIIGMDFYYKPEFHGYDAAKGFAYIRDDVYGLQWLENFAKLHGKPTSYSEWGVQGDYSAEFVNLARQWFDSHDVVLQSYWDSNADYPGMLSDNSDPTTGAAYKEAFSGPSTVKLPEGGGASAPAPTLPESGNSTTQTAVSGSWKFQSWGGSDWTGTSANDWHQSSGNGDTMKGGYGDDTYIVTSANDTVIELPGQGVDTVITWLSYTLPANVENLVLTGQGWVSGTGNDLANIIIGNDAPNVLNGKGGNNTLTGGGGADTFVVEKGSGHNTITDFTSGQDKIRLDGFIFESFAALKAAGIQSGSNTVLDLGGGQKLTLQNFKLSALTAGDVQTSYKPVIQDTTVAKASAAWTVQSWGSANWMGSDANDWHQSGGKVGETMRGGNGDDTYYVMHASDKIIETANGGIDTVVTWLSYTLPDHVENLILTGHGWANGTGNSQANIIIGNDAPNVLNGKGGNNILTGGGGTDTFIIEKGVGHNTITDFTSGEDKIKLDGFSFTSFAALKAAGIQSGSHTILNLTDTQTLTLQNFQLANLGSGDVSTTYTPAPIAPPPASSMAKASAAWTKQSWGGSNWVGTDGHDWHQSGGTVGETMRGGNGDDTYSVMHRDDKVIETANGGIDTVVTWLGEYTLPDHVENLTFYGHSWSKGTGNNLDNIIIGNDSPNVLNGKGGNNILTGGGGADTFVIEKGFGHNTITDFARGEDKLQLSGFGKSAWLQHSSGNIFSVHGSDGSTQYVTLQGVTSISSNDYAFV
ncbi:glycosyl hydrolase [Pseudoroseomonas globiformis]|uniref:Glycosyl hydrolase n=1 Tax=Teichococcus globiformis TaxID=2307229 RepID=A0ABV7G860_9PROT